MVVDLSRLFNRARRELEKGCVRILDVFDDHGLNLRSKKASGGTTPPAPILHANGAFPFLLPCYFELTGGVAGASVTGG
jgi:hypothetical protein